VPETDWDEAFRRAAASDTTAVDFAVADDLERGRRRLRARRVAIAAASSLTGVLVLGVALTVPPGSTPEQQVAAPDRSVPSEPDWLLPPAGTPSPRASEATSVPETPKGGGPEPGPMPGEVALEETADWRRSVFEVARSVLDPEGRHLDYSTHSLQSGGDGRGGVHLGIKMGWRVPGQPGEGLVQVRVSDERGFGSSCASVVGEACRLVRVVDGVRYHVLHRDGGFVIRHRQDDGEVVLVNVDRLFGNNSTVAVDSTVTEQEAVRLATDERLDLPTT
jgi:hypothetical protein